MSFSIGQHGILKRGEQRIAAIVTAVEDKVLHLTAFPAGYTPHPTTAAPEDFEAVGVGPSGDGSSATSEESEGNQS